MRELDRESDLVDSKRGVEHGPIAVEQLELLLQLSRDSPSIQIDAATNVDSKIFQTFAAACVLIGLAAAGERHPTAAAAGFEVMAVIGFLVCAAVSVCAVWSSRFRHLVSPPELLNKYWADDRQTVLHAYVADIADGFQHNEDLIAGKHQAFRMALVGLMIEAAGIGFALVVSAY